jgi:hypothetical protein
MKTALAEAQSAKAGSRTLTVRLKADTTYRF